MKVPYSSIRCAAVFSLLLASGSAGSALGEARPDTDAFAAAMRAAHFAEPLVATRPTTPVEDQALAAALADYNRRTAPEDLSSLATYVAVYPHSGWVAAL